MHEVDGTHATDKTNRPTADSSCQSRASHQSSQISSATGRASWTVLDDDQLLAQCEVDTYRASGPGGQKRNKTSSAVRLRHSPSGLIVIAEESRSQHENKAKALKRLQRACISKFANRLRPKSSSIPILHRPAMGKGGCISASRTHVFGRPSGSSWMCWPRSKPVWRTQRNCSGFPPPIWSISCKPTQRFGKPRTNCGCDSARRPSDNRDATYDGRRVLCEPLLPQSSIARRWPDVPPLLLHLGRSAAGGGMCLARHSGATFLAAPPRGWTS